VRLCMLVSRSLNLTADICRSAQNRNEPSPIAFCHYEATTQCSAQLLEQMVGKLSDDMSALSTSALGSSVLGQRTHLDPRATAFADLLDANPALGTNVVWLNAYYDHRDE
jgi:hypothetical protein